MTTRIIVCGSRDWTDWDLLDETLCDLLNSLRAGYVGLGVSSELVLVHGACPFGGADAMAERWAKDQREEGWKVTTEPHPSKTPVTAGFHARNQEMADLGAKLCIGFTNGRNKSGTWGTGDMFSRALAAGIPIRGVPGRRA